MKKPTIQKARGRDWAVGLRVGLFQRHFLKHSDKVNPVQCDEDAREVKGFRLDPDSPGDHVKAQK